MLVLSVLLSACASLAPTPQREPTTVSEEHALVQLLADRTRLEPAAMARVRNGGRDVLVELARMLALRSEIDEVVPWLELLARHEDASVRAEAVRSMGELGDVSFGDSLMTALGDPEERVGVEAVDALRRLGLSLTSVISGLEALDDAFAWSRVLPSLERFAPSVQRRALARLAVQEPDLPADLRARAACALDADAEDVPSTQALRQLQAIEALRFEPCLLRALGRRGAWPAQLSSGSAPILLVPWLEGIAAGLGIWSSVPPETMDFVLEVVGAGIESQVPALVASALAVAVQVDPGLARASLDSCAGRRAPWRVLLCLEVAAALDAAPQRDELLGAALASDSSALRRIAAGAWTHLSDDARVALLADPHPAVRALAMGHRYRALAGREDDSSRQLLEDMLTDSEGVVRRRALVELAIHPVLDAEEITEKLALSPADATARRLLVAALEARAQVEPLERGWVVVRLERLAEDASVAVRSAAQRSLKRLGRPPVEHETARSSGLEYYRQLIARTRGVRDVVVSTTVGELVIRIDCSTVPRACLSFTQLAQQGYYDGMGFGRWDPSIGVWAGDPDGDGFGGPGYALRDELSAHSLASPGVLALERTGPDSAGGRFLLTQRSALETEASHVAIGRVVEGGDVVFRLGLGTQIERIRVRESAP